MKAFFKSSMPPYKEESSFPRELETTCLGLEID
jgi:hypothetical protein